MATIAATAGLPELTADDLARYSRHLILPKLAYKASAS